VEDEYCQEGDGYTAHLCAELTGGLTDEQQPEISLPPS